MDGMSMATQDRKIVSLCFFVCGVTAGLVVRELATTIWAVAHLAQPAWVVTPADLFGVGAGFITFLALLKSERAGTYLSEVLVELTRVVWPQRKETVLSTGVVSVLVGICALLLFLFDMIWGTFVSTMLSGQ